MSYLKFNMSRMVNLEYSLAREILRTNRRGAYHCTTLVECNTRKQHGLLVMPVPKLDDHNHVMLSSFDETVIQHGAEFNLGLHKYDGENYSPMGHKYIREFDCDSIPRTTYRVGGVILSKEKMFSLDDNNILIRYTLLDSHSPTVLRFRPFLAFRSINALTGENDKVNKSFREVTNGISTCMYEGYPELFMQFSKKVKFVFDPVWHKGIEYKRDMEDGFPYKEDLYVPGYFELPIKKGETIVFSAGDKKSIPSKLLDVFENGIRIRTPRSSFYNCLRNSANQFFYRPNNKDLYLLEGYPWFGVDARSQFMSLPGLTMCLDRDEAFEEVMDSAMPAVKQFMAGEPVTGPIKNMDAPDVLLWLVWSLGRYANRYKDICHEKYGAFMLEIINFILKGKHDNLFYTELGLLYTNGRERPASWMNTTNMGVPIVPRTGFLVEINALWYNALMLALDVAKTNNNPKIIKELTKIAENVKISFNEMFVNGYGYLFDYVDGNILNWSVRPNMIIATSMNYSPLDKKVSKSILDIVTKELLTSKGLRTLSPKSEGYSPYYQGSQYEKNYAAFNGIAYPWLLRFYTDSYLKVFQRSGVFFIDRLVGELEEEMANDCIGSLSQLYDGNPPYTGHSAISYAVNVAGILSVLDAEKKFDNEIKEIQI